MTAYCPAALAVKSVWRRIALLLWPSRAYDGVLPCCSGRQERMMAYCPAALAVNSVWRRIALLLWPSRAYDGVLPCCSGRQELMMAYCHAVLAVKSVWWRIALLLWPSRAYDGVLPCCSGRQERMTAYCNAALVVKSVWRRITLLRMIAYKLFQSHSTGFITRRNIYPPRFSFHLYPLWSHHSNPLSSSTRVGRECGRQRWWTGAWSMRQLLSYTHVACTHIHYAVLQMFLFVCFSNNSKIASRCNH